ncbi:MAG: hypothetical protein KDB03_24160 [Planctomycetales bacterium]|nr:hypothetical protein [Planctomycetales bacterium]
MKRLLIWAYLALTGLLGSHANSETNRESLDFGDSLDIGSRRELFVDDRLIESMTEGITWELVQPQPCEVVLTTDAPWEGNTSAYYTVLRDDDRFRMYYRGSHWDNQKQQSPHREVTCYAESQDGIHWTKPALGLFEFEGSRANNIVLDGLGTHCFAAFKDLNPACDPSARYKGISRGRPVGERGLYTFQSADGLHWQQSSAQPVITEGAFDSQNLAFWDSKSQVYREYHRTFVDGVRAIMTSDSKDWANWTSPRLLEYQATIPAEHLYTNAVQPYVRAPHLLLGFPTRYLPSQGQRVEPTLMASRDGVHFFRWLEPVIPEDAPQDRRGNRSNYMAWGVVELDSRPNHLSVYATEAYYEGPDSRVRRFEYRKDGFVKVAAGDQVGALITKPIRFSGSRLELNYACQKSGQLRVELQDARGQPLPGFSIAECEPLKGDALADSVKWNQGSDVSRLAGQVIKIRFELQRANLYAFQFVHP